MPHSNFNTSIIPLYDFFLKKKFDLSTILYSNMCQLLYKLFLTFYAI